MRSLKEALLAGHAENMENLSFFAARDAWDFVEKSTGDMELVVFNPIGIFGPVLVKTFGSSIGLTVYLLSGK